jgi:alpha-galactosidase
MNHATLSNGILTISLATAADGSPVCTGIRCATMPDFEWALPGGSPLTPTLATATGPLAIPTFSGYTLRDTTSVSLSYAGSDGLLVTQHLSLSPSHPVIRSQVTVAAGGTTPLKGLVRFDALSLSVAVSPYEPEASYVLGWLDIARIDAPGRPPTAVKLDNWIDKLLYGDTAPFIPPLPEAGWSSPTMRLVTERLMRLPLTSGKRGTWNDFPWVAVRDPGRAAGIFAGFEWSGTWKMLIDHPPGQDSVSVSAFTDGCSHDVAPGQSLESPPAFLGFFSGDWDAAFNASRRYTADDILPKPHPALPTVHYVFFPGSLLGKKENQLYFVDKGADTRARARSMVDAAADLGAESFLLDSLWWGAAPDEGDFSNGLGDFTVNARRFPDGLKSLSDYVHQKNMLFGLWFEFERVDIRTANKGRNPWRPEWIMHRNGHPYRSWGQHFFMLCLGEKAAAEWALENISWAIREYGVDWFMIDSNEWAVCQDPSHTHGAGDGEWAQIQGLYHVLRGLRERFPKLIIDNGAGGAQRGDFGMARHCDVMPCSDINCPSVLNRQYSVGYGSFYPSSYARQGVYFYPTRETGALAIPSPNKWSEPWHPMKVNPGEPPERTEWRCINRMMGVFQPIHDLSIIPADHLAVLKKCIATYKGVRPTLAGDRYLLAGPPVFVERENRESGAWEAYQHVARDGSVASVLFYRCLSPDASFSVRLKGLVPGVRYRAQYHTGRAGGVHTGSELMSQGITCTLPGTRQAEVLLLRREG